MFKHFQKQQSLLFQYAVYSKSVNTSLHIPIYPNTSIYHYSHKTVTSIHRTFTIASIKASGDHCFSLYMHDNGKQQATL